MHLFIDSSALVKRYRQEDGSATVALRLRAATRLIISRLTLVEVSAALVRRAHSSGVRPGAVSAALAALDRDAVLTFDVVELDPSLMQYASELARTHHLRGADAVQLACAIVARAELNDKLLVMLSCDEELNNAACAEGFHVDDPTRSSPSL